MRLRAPKSRVFGFWLMAFLAGAVASTARAGEAFLPPVLELMHVDIRKANPLKQDFVLHFRISNPNESSLPVRNLAYRVYLGDIEVVDDGESRQSLTVPAHSYRDIKVTTRTNLWRYMKPLVKLLKKSKEPVPYRLSGEVRTGRFLFGQTLPFFHSGELANREMLAGNP